MTPDQPGHRGHGLKVAVGHRPEPADEELLRAPGVSVVPELPEEFLEGPGPGDLEVAPLEGPEGNPLFGDHGLGAHEPEVFGPLEPRSSACFRRVPAHANDARRPGHGALPEEDYRTPVEPT